LTSPFDEPENYPKYSDELELSNVENNTVNENETNYTNGDYLLMNSTNQDLEDRPKLDDITSSTFEHPEMAYDELYMNGRDSKEYTSSVNGYITPESMDALHRTQKLLLEKEAANDTEIKTPTETDKLPMASSINEVPQEATIPQTMIKELVTFRRPGTIVVTTLNPPVSSSTADAEQPSSSPTYLTGVKTTMPTEALTVPYSGDATEKIRTVRRKERNRVAAKRCRQRKAEYVHDLEQQVATLQHQIHELQDKLKQLQKDHEVSRRSLVDETSTYDLRHKKIERHVEE
jgi:ribosomal protein S15P/S13E